MRRFWKKSRTRLDRDPGRNESDGPRSVKDEVADGLVGRHYFERNRALTPKFECQEVAVIFADGHPQDGTDYPGDKGAVIIALNHRDAPAIRPLPKIVEQDITQIGCRHS